MTRTMCVCACVRVSGHFVGSIFFIPYYHVHVHTHASADTHEHTGMYIFYPIHKVKVN